MVKTAIILAGGLGTRLREAVPDLPKPMAPVNNRPFLAHQLDYWISQGIERFVLSVGYKHELIVNYFGHEYNGAQIDYVIEQTPMGTGGGFLLALEKIGRENPFLLLNGDTYFAVDLKQLIQFANDKAADWSFSLFSTDDPGRYLGMDVSPEGRIVALKSENKEAQGRLANGGVYWVNPAALPDSLLDNWSGKISLEDDFFPAALAAGSQLFGLEASGAFIDIGVPNDYHRSATILPRM